MVLKPIRKQKTIRAKIMEKFKFNYIDFERHFYKKLQKSEN